MPRFNPKPTLMAGLAALALLAALWVSRREGAGEAQPSVPPAASGLPHAAETRSAVTAVAMGASVAPASRPRPEAAAGEVASRWRAARERYAADGNWAVLIQQALAEPTAEGLFYAMHAMQLCEAARTFESMDLPANAPCRLALEYHQGWGEVFRKQRSLAMSTEDRTTLDAVLGDGDFRKATPGERWAAVQATGDPLVLAEIAAGWAGRSDATFSGARLSGPDAIAFMDAWAVAACTRAGNCEASIGAIRLCKHQGQCEGSLVTRLGATMTPEQIERFRRALASVQAALDSGDLSAFGP